MDLSVEAIALGVEGTVSVTARGLDSAGREFIATGSITVVPALEPTVQASIEFGTPVDQ